MTEISEDELRKIVKDVNTAQRLPTMSLSAIDEMVARKRDLEFQCALCSHMMTKGQFLPFAFERAAALLRKAHRHEAERVICEYTEMWAKRSQAEYQGGAMLWLSPKVQKLIARLAQLRLKDC
jgi:hypothetical protein